MLFGLLVASCLIALFLILRYIWRCFDGKLYLSTLARFHLTVDLPNARNIITAVLRCSGDVTRSGFADFAIERLGNVIPFTHAVSLPQWFGVPHYVPVDGFKILDNIFEHRLAVGATHGDFMEQVARICAISLSFDAPLWQIHLLRAVGDADEPEVPVNPTTYLLYRFHHCLGDGVAGVKLLFTLSDRLQESEIGPSSLPSSPSSRETGSSTPSPRPRFIPPPKPGIFKWICLALRSVISDLSRKPTSKEMSLSKRHGEFPGLDTSFSVGDEPLLYHVFTNTVDDGDDESRRTETVDEDVVVCRSSSLPDSPLPLNSSTSFAVDDVKRVAYKYNVTFNDVIMSVVSSGYRKYFFSSYGSEHDRQMLEEGRIDDLTNITYIKLGEPFGALLRRLCADEDYCVTSEEMTVDVGMVLHQILAHIEDDVERMRESNRLLRALYYDPSPLVTTLFVKMLGSLPFGLTKHFAVHLGKATFQCSNVPGPAHARTICGSRLEGCWFFGAPILGSFSCLVSVFTYHGRICYCLSGAFGREKQKALFDAMMESMREHLTL